MPWSDGFASLFVGDVLVIYGDCPLITPETLQELCELRGDAPWIRRQRLLSSLSWVADRKV